MIGFDLIVANYNNGHFLQELVNSVKEQSFPHWHIYIVDDCSSDDSRSIIRQIAKEDNITAIFLEENGGATHAFKTGIEAGSNPLVGLIGADDALPPESLATMLKAIEKNPDGSLYYSQCLDCDSGLNPIALRNHAKPLDSDVEVFHQLYSIFNFLVFPRAKYEKTDGLNSMLRRAMDHDLILKLDEVGTIHFVPEVCYLYRNHERGISQGGNGWMASQYSVLARLDAYQRRTNKPISINDYRKLTLSYHERCVEMSRSFTEHRLLYHWIQILLRHPVTALRWKVLKGLARPLMKSLKPQRTP